MPKEFKNVRYDYRDHVVLVTGAARGMGRAHALGFAQAGADVIICDICEDIDGVNYAMATKDDLDSVTSQVGALGGRCLSFVCDVRDDGRVREVVEDAIANLGKIDVLINNAGVGAVDAIGEMTNESWDAVLDSQLGGARNFSRAVAAPMISRGRGKILSTGSTSSVSGAPRNSHYVAAKHAMLGLTRALAVELGPHGINVNMVCPGAVETPMAVGMSSANPDWVEELSLLGGSWNLFDPTAMLQSEDITQALLWLASDAAAMVTGVGLVVDAGFTLT